MSKEKLVNEIKTKINNTNAPKKPSDNKAWQAGFKECFEQVIEIINEFKPHKCNTCLDTKYMRLHSGKIEKCVFCED